MKTTFGLPKRREEVINLLQEAYADGNLEDEDYEARLTQAMEAKSVEALQVVVKDFPNPPQLLQPDTKASTMPRQSPAGSPSLDSFRQGQNFPFKFAFTSRTPSGFLDSFRQGQNFPAVLSSQKVNLSQAISQPLKIKSILGDHKMNLTRAQVVGDQLLIHVECILGEATVDLRAQDLKGKKVFVYVHNFMGEVKILLPKGVQADSRVNPILGEVKHSNRRVSKIIAKLMGQEKVSTVIPYNIYLTGNCILGTVRLIHE